MRGTWDAIHVFEVAEKSKSAHYKLTSTVMLTIETETEKTGKVNLSGNLTRQEEKDYPVQNPQSHIANIGRLIEDMENKLRMALDTIYFGKTKDIVMDLRSVMSTSILQQQRSHMMQIGSAINKH